MVVVPASITIEEGSHVNVHKWKNEDKVSVYRGNSKRAVVRITGSRFVKELSKKKKEQRQVSINFNKVDGEWGLVVSRTREGCTLQTYFSSHPYIQLVLNRHLSKEIWDEYKVNNKKTYSRRINVEFDLTEWGDIKLKPYDFIIKIERLSKQLMKEALRQRFVVDFVSKGRAYDLELVGPKNKRFIIAISSHVAKNESRSKEKRKQKILMDIAKMLTVLYTKKAVPIVISEPLSFQGSWSFTTPDYLDFYKDAFNFRFLTTNFKKDWAVEICKQLLKIDSDDKPQQI